MQQVAAVADVACNKSARIKPAEAARRLSINRSSLKRYLDRYSDLIDENGKVDFDELAKHRGDNPTIEQSSETPKRNAAPAASDSRKGSKHRVEEIKAWEAERDWAKTTGQLVDPTAIIDALAEAAVALRDKFMAPDAELCEQLAGESDPRTVMTLLRDANRKALDAFAASMKRAAGSGAAVDNADS